jgi:hypothetical protein
VEQQRLSANVSQQEANKDVQKGKAPPAKVDPKAKDAKPAPGKPATAADDKNAPKADFKVDYPEVQAEPNFLVLERNFLQKQPTVKIAQQSKKKD